MTGRMTEASSLGTKPMTYILEPQSACFRESWEFLKACRTLLWRVKALSQVVLWFNQVLGTRRHRSLSDLSPEYSTAGHVT